MTGGSRAVVAVDISGWLVSAMKTIEAARSYHIKPKIPIKEAVHYVMARHKVIVEHGNIDPCYVFDNCRNPMKANTNRDRTSQVQVALAKLTRLLQTGRMQDLGEIDEERKKSTEIRSDLIAELVSWMQKDKIMFCGAPFEAEWQMVYLEKVGLVDALMSEDGDCIGLGAKTVISEVVYKGKNTGTCTIYRSNEIFQRESAGNGQWVNFKAELACFLGTDFNKPICGTGAKSIVKLMDCYISKTTEEMRFAYLQSLEKEGFYDREKKKPAVGFADSFIKTRNLFQCAPIFSVAVAGGHDKIDLLDPPNYELVNE